MIDNTIRYIFEVSFKIYAWIFKAIFKCFEYLIGSFKTKEIHGSAKWAGKLNTFAFLNAKNDGLVINGLDRLDLKHSFNHMAVIAPTGAGKTTGYIIPNVLQLNHSMLITDPSGEIYQKTRKHLRQKGFKLKTINPNDLKHTHFYNPLAKVKTDTEIKKISDILITNAYPEPKGDQEFWNNAARNIINIVIRVLKKGDPKKNNLAGVRNLLQLYGSSQFDQTVAQNAVQSTLNEFLGFERQDTKVKQGAISTAKYALEPFSDPDLCQLTEIDTIRYEDLRNRLTAIFVIVPEHEISYYSFLLSMMYTQIFNFCATMHPGSKNFPVFFLMDEFGNSGKIPNFETLITTLRKRSCSISIILQDLKQVTKIYGKDSDSTIINGGCTGKIFFPGLGIETCTQIEKMLGQKTVNQSTEFGKKQMIGRSLYTADEVRRMRPDEAIFFYGNRPPIKLKITPYYNNNSFQSRIP